MALSYEKFDVNGELYISSFLIDDTVADGQPHPWKVTADSIPRNIESFVGAPLVLYEKGKNYFDHPLEGRTLLELVQNQQRYAIGRIEKIVKSGGKWKAISRITNPLAREAIKNNEIPFFVSPTIVHDPSETDHVHSNWQGLQLAIVSDPAYGVNKAKITGLCEGSFGTCFPALASAGFGDFFKKVKQFFTGGPEEATFETQGDAKVCPICDKLDGKEYEIDEETGIIDGPVIPDDTHPNCRCYYETSDGQALSLASKLKKGKVSSAKRKKVRVRPPSHRAKKLMVEAHAAASKGCGFCPKQTLENLVNKDDSSLITSQVQSAASNFQQMDNQVQAFDASKFVPVEEFNALKSQVETFKVAAKEAETVYQKKIDGITEERRAEKISALVSAKITDSTKAAETIKKFVDAKASPELVAEAMALIPVTQATTNADKFAAAPTASASKPDGRWFHSFNSFERSLLK